MLMAKLRELEPRIEVRGQGVERGLHFWTGHYSCLRPLSSRVR